MPLLTSEILYPTMANRFKFNGFHFLSNVKNKALMMQIISANFAFNQKEGAHPYPSSDGMWTVKLVVEDNARGEVTNIIQDIVTNLNGQYKKSFMTFNIMDEIDNYKSVLRVEDVRLDSVNFDFDYAISGTAKWYLTFSADSIERTVD